MHEEVGRVDDGIPRAILERGLVRPAIWRLRAVDLERPQDP